MLLFKDRSKRHFFALERIPNFTILFAFLSSKNAPIFRKICPPTGVEQAFHACGKAATKVPSSRRRPGVPDNQGSRLIRSWQAGMGDARLAWPGRRPARGYGVEQAFMPA